MKNSALAIVFVALVTNSALADAWTVHCNATWKPEFRAMMTPVNGLDQLQFVVSAETRRYRREVAGLQPDEPALIWRRTRWVDQIAYPASDGDERVLMGQRPFDDMPYAYMRDDENFWPKVDRSAEGEAEDIIYQTTLPFNYRFGSKRGTVSFHVHTADGWEWWAWPDFPHYAELAKRTVPIEFWIAYKDTRDFTGWRYSFVLRSAPRQRFANCN